VNYQQITIVGRLGRDPEQRHTQGGDAVTTLSVAVSETWTDKQGQRQEATEWFRVEVWGRQADACSQYLCKGQIVTVAGKIKTEEWTDKEGAKKTTVKVRADRVEFGPRPVAREEAAPPPSAPALPRERFSKMADATKAPKKDLGWGAATAAQSWGQRPGDDPLPF
jgi:single-strand DNA-binding protein